MHASADRLEFAPPPEPAAIRAFVLAILAHLLLMLALTWGISWNRDAENVAAEAELWSSVPQQAAPKVVTAPPLPTPPPKPEPKPEPKVEPPPAPPVSKAPDIAVEREKKRRELAERRQEELEREKKLEAARKKREELELEKKLEARKKQEELKRQEVAEQKAEEEKKKKKAEELAKAKKEKQDEAKVEAQRKENLEKMMKAAAGTGAPSSTGTAARSSGMSASYAGRIAAKIKPNIVFADIVSGNPAAIVEIRVAPDGTIVGRKLVESSGVKSWDEAVLRAIDKTEVIPRDTDGRVVPQFPVRFRPND